eukprot:6483929-Amphidinium_carterae.1
MAGIDHMPASGKGQPRNQIHGEKDKKGKVTIEEIALVTIGVTPWLNLRIERETRLPERLDVWHNIRMVSIGPKMISAMDWVNA